MLVAHNPKEENMQKTKDAKRRRPPKPFAPGGYELFHNGLYRQKIIPDKKKAEKRKRKKVDMREYQPFLSVRLSAHFLFSKIPAFDHVRICRVPIITF